MACHLLGLHNLERQERASTGPELTDAVPDWGILQTLGNVAADPPCLFGIHAATQLG